MAQLEHSGARGVFHFRARGVFPSGIRWVFGQGQPSRLWPSLRHWLEQEPRHLRWRAKPRRCPPTRRRWYRHYWRYW